MISDELYAIAWENSENQNIINSASKRFRGIIPEDDMESCQMVGLWGSLKKFDESYNSNFFTYLYNGIVLECRKWLATNRKHLEANKKRKCLTLDSIAINNVCHDIELEEIIDILPDELCDVLKQRFYKNMTYDEISKQNGYSRETARRKINKGLDKLKYIV